MVPTSIIAEDNIIAPPSVSSWFSGCTKVNKIDLSKVDTGNVTNMYHTFYKVGSDSTVTSMTISGIYGWDISKVYDMTQMFYNFGLNATYTLDLSGWNVPKITSCYGYRGFNSGVETKVIAPTWNITS